MRTHSQLAMVIALASLFSDAISAEDYQVDDATGFRMERYRAPVPESVPGGITVNSATTMAAHENNAWVFIDVYPPRGLGPDPLDGHWVTSEDRASMPGAVWLPEVGRGHLEPDAIDYFKRNLDALTASKKSTPIVFYCTSDCWQSWNASVRAISWGYSEVKWYPLGTDGWLEEGGTLESVEPIHFFATADTPTLSDPSAYQSVDQSTALVATPAVFPPTATIYLIDQAGDELAIGTLRFSSTGKDDASYTVDVAIESPEFSDQFLSMRPFDCLAQTSEWYCYLPYTYDLTHTVTEDDLTDLEYQLLFIWKSPKNFGIDAWNGIYYKLSKQNDGSLMGELLQGDFNVLASPPETNARPINLDEFISDGSEKRRFPAMIIRP